MLLSAGQLKFGEAVFELWGALNVVDADKLVGAVFRLLKTLLDCGEVVDAAVPPPEDEVTLERADPMLEVVLVVETSELDPSAELTVLRTLEIDDDCDCEVDIAIEAVCENPEVEDAGDVLAVVVTDAVDVDVCDVLAKVEDVEGCDDVVTDEDVGGCDVVVDEEVEDCDVVADEDVEDCDVVGDGGVEGCEVVADEEVEDCDVIADEDVDEDIESCDMLADEDDEGCDVAADEDVEDGDVVASEDVESRDVLADEDVEDCDVLAGVDDAEDCDVLAEDSVETVLGLVVIAVDELLDPEPDDEMVV